MWPRPRSVAQHSLTPVLLLRRHCCDSSARVQLLELLKEAEEGSVGFDPISSFKLAFGMHFKTDAAAHNAVFHNNRGDSHAVANRAR